MWSTDALLHMIRGKCTLLMLNSRLHGCLCTLRSDADLPNKPSEHLFSHLLLGSLTAQLQQGLRQTCGTPVAMKPHGRWFGP